MHLSITSKAIIFISQTCKKIREMRRIMEYVQMFLKLTDSRETSIAVTCFSRNNTFAMIYLYDKLCTVAGGVVAFWLAHSFTAKRSRVGFPSLARWKHLVSLHSQ